MDEICQICSDDIRIFAVGNCDHPVCHRCSTRMRVLCDQMYCPICRQDLSEVILVKKLKKFESIEKAETIQNRRYKMVFEDRDMEYAFNKLLEHKCPVCITRPPEDNLQTLRYHMRIKHKLFYCDLCVKNLKSFTHERKVYTQDQLGRHRHKGDPDDRSHRGHPLCEFCNRRYMDKDELYRHLRKDHYYCHFCDEDASYQFYSNYEFLLQHFSKEHFVCEEGECTEAQFTHAFRTDIDLKAHKASHHNQNLTKAQARQARTLELEFQLPPRGRARVSDFGSGRNEHKTDADTKARSRNQRSKVSVELSEPDVRKAILASLEDQEHTHTRGKENGGSNNSDSSQSLNFNHQQDFPSLSWASPDKETVAERQAAVAQAHWPGRAATSSANTSSIRRARNLKVFPTLTGANTSLQCTMGTDLSNQHSQKSEVTICRQKQHAIASFGSEDFPQLPAAAANQVSIILPNAWSGTSGGKNEKLEKSCTSPVCSSQCSSGENISSSKDLAKILHSNDDFPSLSKNGRSINGTASWPMKKTKNGSRAQEGESKGLDQQRKEKNKKQKSVSEVSKNSPSSKHANTAGSSTNAATANSSATFAMTTTATTPVVLSNRSCQEQKNAQDLHVQVSKGESVSLKFDVKPKKNHSRSAETAPPKISVTEKDFPMLVPSKVNKFTPPPGFKSSQIKPPPGFMESSNKPPPGLSVCNRSLAGLNSTLDSHLDNIQFCYRQPLSFNDRNKRLIVQIRTVLGDDRKKFETFKVLSKQYRQGEITADNYYKRCHTLLGQDQFDAIFVELVTLLPDIEKQQALFVAYKELQQKREADYMFRLSRQQMTTMTKLSWLSTLASCPLCQQVLSETDYEPHLSLMHSVDKNSVYEGHWENFRETSMIKAN